MKKLGAHHVKAPGFEPATEVAGAAPHLEHGFDHREVDQQLLQEPLLEHICPPPRGFVPALVGGDEIVVGKWVADM